LFVFKYYRDTAAGPGSSGETVMFIALERLSGTPTRNSVVVEALLVMLDGFMEDEGDDTDPELLIVSGIARLL
jgi:hypothetical protein